MSVTQQMNTTDSLGRLTLNILLSFAQFERELIAERTRDKMRAARRKGKWLGGCPVLGFDVNPQGGLKINVAEAERVRFIFERIAETATMSARLQSTLTFGDGSEAIAFGGSCDGRNTVRLG